MVCPTLSYNKKELIGCYKEKCTFYNPGYGCLQAKQVLCEIEQWELEKNKSFLDTNLETSELKINEQKLIPQGDINIL